VCLLADVGVGPDVVCIGASFVDMSTDFVSLLVYSDPYP